MLPTSESSLSTILSEQHVNRLSAVFLDHSHIRMASSDLDIKHLGTPYKHNLLCPIQLPLSQILKISETTPKQLKGLEKCVKDVIGIEKKIAVLTTAAKKKS